ncbi:hypothetical protein HMPREF1556_01186 [Porphyromonas sp. oral taxon 278 str. W7784]|nr:hypothetical protein HMPREF1556_01186 [Porphyromonas sp. oral taxon 278 str. W7784]
MGVKERRGESERRGRRNTPGSGLLGASALSIWFQLFLRLGGRGSFPL